MAVFDTLDELRGAAGTHLGWTDWMEVDQARVHLFADATGDHQWIPVDVERATAESPFGGPIAHGYLTLALSNLFLPQLLEELTEREAFGRAAEPWEVDTVIAFLASDYSTYMTGEVVSVSSQRA